MLRSFLKIPMLILPLVASSPHGVAAEADTQRLTASVTVIDEIMATSDKAVPQKLFAKSYCAVVVPNMKKAGFIFSGKYGRGFASCRNPEGGWTAPAAMRVEGGGAGLQIGASESDIVMLVMSEKGMKGLLASKFSLGGEVSAAAGPVGRDSTAQTDASMRADILSWSRSRGVFGGISLQGSTLRGDEDVDKALYGKSETSSDILTGKVKAPSASMAFLDTLAKYGGKSQSK